jgi:hypothetical protein
MLKKPKRKKAPKHRFPPAPAGIGVKFSYGGAGFLIATFDQGVIFKQTPHYHILGGGQAGSAISGGILQYRIFFGGLPTSGVVIVNFYDPGFRSAGGGYVKPGSYAYS